MINPAKEYPGHNPADDKTFKNYLNFFSQRELRDLTGERIKRSREKRRSCLRI
ncbi:MAG: hypothetical protein ACHQNT_12255 [Bacteroidia bacterium]